MRTVHKFPLGLDTPSTVHLPAGAEFRRFACQRGHLTLWYEVESEVPAVHPHLFQIVGTGHPIPSGAAYLSSTEDGPFVWHLYRLGASEAPS